MSVAIKGLRPPRDFIPVGIVLDYLNFEIGAKTTRWFCQFFADLAKEYSTRVRLNTYIHSVYPLGLPFENSDLTRYMSSEQRDAMRKSGVTAEKVNGFIQQLHRRGGIAKIAVDLSNYEQYPTLALTAHMLGGDVTQEQVVSTCLLYHAIEQFIKEPYVVQIHYDFVPKPETISLFKNSAFVQRFFKLDNDQMTKLFERVKSKPDSEHYYHVIALPLGPIASPGHLVISNIINRFRPVIVEIDSEYELERSVIVVPSFSMLQACAYVLYGDDAMDYVPLIGVCTKKEIEHFKMQDKCVFQVGTREARLRRRADGRHYGQFSRALHDWYHGERGCWLGAHGRRAIRYIVGHIFASAQDKETLALIWDLLDGELWDKNQNFAHLFTEANSWTEEHKRAVIRNMALLKLFWEIEFNIKPEQLLPADKSLYDAIAAGITPEQRQAAEQALFQYYNTRPEKDRDTHFRLAWLYYTGYGTAVSLRKAIEHWAHSGLAQALYNIAKVYEAETENPFRQGLVYIYCLAAAQKGYRQAQYDIGCWYYSADAFVNFERRWDLALDFFKRAADQNHPAALYSLGIMYRDGEGVPTNLDDAYSYFKRAADLGIPSAQYEIGHWFYNGNRIFPRDFTQARQYFKLAAAQNHPLACYALSRYYTKGLGVAKDPQRAFFYLKKSAELGYKPAIELLKKTVPPKQKKRRHFARSFALGNPVAREKLKRLKA